MKESNLSSAFQSHKKGKFSRSDTRTCFDFNSSWCNRSICSFPHKCSKFFASDIPNLNVGGEHWKLPDPWQVQLTQLIKHLFKSVTPINPSKLDQVLQDHPDRELLQKVVTGFQKGFSLKYNGLRENHHPCNLPTAFSYPEKLWDSVMKEVKLGRMLGPFPVQPIDLLICSPIGMVEKKNSTDVRRITHLIYPHGASINSFIDPEYCKTNYQTGHSTEAGSKAWTRMLFGKRGL